MYIGARQKKQFVSFLILLFLLAFAGATVFWLSKEVGEGSAPRDVVLSNVWEGSASVSWLTEIKTEGYLALYHGGEKVGDFKDVRGGRHNVHYVNVVGLKPNTNYEFEIVSSGQNFLNEEDEKYKFTTRVVLPFRPVPSIVNGFVDATDGLVFLLLDDLNENYPISTYVLEDGSWSLDLSKFLPLDFDDDFVLRADDSLKMLFFGREGSKIVRGHKRLLFNEENFFEDSPLALDGTGNVFVHLSEISKFKKRPAVVVNERIEEVEKVEMLEEDIGVEDIEPVGEVQGVQTEQGIQWGTLDDLF